MSMTAQQITAYLTEALPDAVVELTALANDDDHWSVTVTSAAFAGKSRVAQHKMVYDALQGHMGATLHALQVKTSVPVS